MEISRKSEATSAFDSKWFGREYSCEVKEPVGAMSISPCGRDVVLASRQGLHLIDLDDPYAPPRHLPHYTPWEVADVQWSPFATRDYWVVSTSNQKALVWNLMMNDMRSAVEHYLHAHTRAITDINFSAHHPDILATCAVDSFVHCWDLRHPIRPALSFADWFAGATQVKWNRQDRHIVASSHDRTLHIWDDRNGALPLHSIEAHDTKIYGLDWNRVRTTALITCSLDKTIKFWDYSADLQSPEKTIETSFPIWRARHTPFGHGILAMPQRYDNNLYLYDRRPSTQSHDISSPVKSFQGHKAQVKEFLWRCRGNIDDHEMDQREFQLVTWGADHTLRVHAMDDNTLANVGYVKGQKSHGRLHLTRSNASYKTFRSSASKSEIKTVKSSSSLHEQLNTSPSFNIVKSGMTLRGRSMAVSEDFLNAQTNTTHKRDLDPISWMKGVKAGKKEYHPDESITSDGIADHRLHRGSEEFESLGEEIAHIGTKFGMVKFDHVDVNKREIEFNIRGAWDKESPTYLPCRIEFPETYPVLSAPVLTVEKTALSDHDLLHRIEKDIEVIGKAYLRLQRSSLEAIIRYLHGDQSLEDALRWTTRELGTTMTSLRSDEESSSDEDDIGQHGEDYGSEFGLVDSGLFGQPNVNAHMPIAKTSAGVWSQNGTLVCFFPPKAKNTTLVGSLGSHRQVDLLRAKKKGLLGPFGKFTSSSHGRSKVQSISSLDDQEPSSESDFSESEYSSSASSASSRETDPKDVLTIAQHVFDVDQFEVSRYGSERILDGTLQSVDSLNGSNYHGLLPRSTISLHDARDLLPAKEELATGYACSGPDACRINAAVATKHGYFTIAEVWRLLDLILCNKFIKCSGSIPTSKPLPKRIPSRIIDKKGITNNGSEGFLQTVDFVKWSSHPFGGRLFIKNLFEYYASIADIQMLAMMSCILSEHNQSLIAFEAAKEYDFSTDSRNAHGQDHSSFAKGLNKMFPEHNGFQRRASSLRSPMKMNHDGGGMSSSFETVINGGSLESSGPDTVLNRSFEAQSTASKLSSSPEWIRPLHRSGTNLANAIMALPLPFSLTTSAASSPPTASFMKKKVSPIGSLSIPAGLKAGDSSASGVSFSQSNSTKTSEGRPHVNHQTSPTKTTPGMTFKIKSKSSTYHGDIKNDLLLDPTMGHLYQTWRDSYAELLLSWDLLIPHAEMRKTTGLSSYNTSQEPNTDKQSFTTSTESTIKHSPDSTRSVQPLLHCQSSNTTHNLPNDKPHHTYHDQCTTICALCNLPIHGRSSPCFICGHILHISCRETWELAHPGTPCPTGCNCICSSPTIPPSGIISFYTTNTNTTTTNTNTNTNISTPQLPSPTSSYFPPSSSSTYLRSSSPHSTIRSTQDPAAGVRTPHSSKSAIAYATLASLAAHSRPRGDTAGARHASAAAAAAAAAADKLSAKLRPSRSLMFAGVGALGGVSGGASGGASSVENKKKLKLSTGRMGNAPKSGRRDKMRSGLDVQEEGSLDWFDDSDVEGR